jgi:uncharacterized glyoxalase superfamily protein PhnB
MQTIFPIFRYDDARRVIQSHCAQFGSVEPFSVPESGQIVLYAQLKLATNVTMLGSTRVDDGMVSQQTLMSATQALCVCLDDLDVHFKRARSAGAEILSQSETTSLLGANTMSAIWKNIPGRFAHICPLENASSVNSYAKRIWHVTALQDNE